MNRLFQEANVPPAQWAQSPKIHYGGRRETLTDVLARETRIQNAIKRWFEVVFPHQEVRSHLLPVNVPRQIPDSLWSSPEIDVEPHRKNPSDEKIDLVDLRDRIVHLAWVREYVSERRVSRYEVRHPAEELCAPPHRQVHEEPEERYRELTAKHFSEGLTEEEQQELERVETRLDELEAGDRELSQVRTQVKQGYTRLQSELQKVSDILDGLLKS